MEVEVEAQPLASDDRRSGSSALLISTELPLASFATKADLQSHYVAQVR